MAKRPMKLKEEILNKGKDMPIVLSEGSLENSRTFAKFSLKKAVRNDLCAYDSNERSNPNDSIYDRTQDPEDEVIDKDPRFREVKFYQPEENDYFEMEKPKQLPKEQVFEDEEIIMAETTPMDPNGNTIAKISLFDNNKTPGMQGTIPEAAISIEMGGNPQSSILIDPEEKANRKKSEEVKNLNELKTLMMKNGEEKQDIAQHIQNMTKNSNYKMYEFQINSTTSANKVIKKQVQQEYEQYNSEARSSHQSEMVVENSPETGENEEEEPPINQVKFKDFGLPEI